MLFNPMSDEEINKVDTAYQPLKPGYIEFEVVSAKEGFSQNGNPQFKLILDAFDGENRSLINVQLTYTEKTLFIFKQFYRCIGMPHLLKNTQLYEAALIKAKGIAVVDHVHDKADPSKVYNNIKKWVYDPQELEHLKKTKEEEKKLNDDISF